MSKYPARLLTLRTIGRIGNLLSPIGEIPPRSTRRTTNDYAARRMTGQSAAADFRSLIAGDALDLRNKQGGQVAAEFSRRSLFAAVSRKVADACINDVP